MKKWANAAAATAAMIVGLAPSTGTALSLFRTPQNALEANVVFGSAQSGIVDVSFEGSFDFSPIGGTNEPFAGMFSYDTSVPPFQTDFSDPNVAIAVYGLDIISFQTFGQALTPLSTALLVQDAQGSFRDFYSFKVTLVFFNAAGVPIPGTSEGLIAIDLSGGAFPPVLFTSPDFPADLDLSASSDPPPTQFAQITPELSTALVLGAGLAVLGASRTERKAPRVCPDSVD
jgi:hypothetical protein